jgi:hypothetical protein
MSGPGETGSLAVSLFCFFFLFSSQQAEDKVLIRIKLRNILDPLAHEKPPYTMPN